MSPEQAQGNNKLLNPQTDIYSLGVILYELLTGRLPFVSAFILDYQDQVVNRPPRPPRTIEDSIPAELEQICLKCLEKAPADRYTTARDLAKALRSSLVSGDKKNNRHLVLLAVPFIALAAFAAMLFNTAKAPEEQRDHATTPLLSSQAINESEPNISSTKLSNEIVKLAHAKPVVTLTPLVWPQDYGDSDFSLFKGNSAIRFNVKGAGLMGFNAPQSKIQSFDVIVNRQYELFGTGGFFNHYINNEKQRGYFDTVQLKMFGEKPNMKLHLYRKGYTYNLKRPDFSNYIDTETSNRVSLETPDRSHVRLRIILEGTKLREVYVDGKLYSKICDARIDSEKNLEKETSNIPYEVDCGLFAFNSVGTFSNLRINDQDVLVSKE
jgi:serine/threonine protein kinase